MGRNVMMRLVFLLKNLNIKLLIKIHTENQEEVFEIWMPKCMQYVVILDILPISSKL
jgi:hypothetical protein